MQREETPSNDSRTMIIAPTSGQDDGSTAETGRTRVVGTLRLRGARTGPRVKWGDDVVDNEGMGKKKSKICCIFHKPKEFDESSDESSSSSSSSVDGEDDSEPDVSNARPSRAFGARRKRHRRHTHAHDRGGERAHHARESDDGDGVDDDRNAYESKP